MQDGKLSLPRKWIGLACLVFDIAAVMAFFKVFAWFSILAPGKSIVMLLVLLAGLAISNAAIVFPRILFKSMDVAYSASLIALLLVYAAAANLLSVFLIAGGIVWYVVWECLLLAAFLGLFSIVAFFSKRRSDDMDRARLEQSARGLLDAQLMEIEAAILAKRNDGGAPSVMHAFAKLKERIHASTPFARIADNHAVTEIEARIRTNLAALQQALDAGPTDLQAVHPEAEALIEETRRLVMNREQLIIK